MAKSYFHFLFMIFILTTSCGVKKDVQDLSTSNSNETVTADTTAPILSLVSLNSGGAFNAGSSQNIVWSASDSNFGTTPITLAYSTDGSNYTAIASSIANTGSYTWTMPTINSTNVTLKITATDSNNNVKSVVSNPLIIDSSSPIVAIVDPTGTVAGGSNLSIIFSSNDSNAISTLKFYFAADGVTFGSPTDLTVGSTSYAFSVPAINVATAKIKIMATDVAGKSSSATTSAFTINSSSVVTPVIVRTSVALANSTTVAIGVTCHADYTKILFSESSTTPTLGDAAWENCAATKNFVVSGSNGVKTIYAFARNAAGAISSSANVTMTLDTTNPTLTLSTVLAAAYKTNDVIALNFSASDTYGLTLLKLEYAEDGSTYVLVSNLATSATTYNWTVPATNTTTAKLRFVATDSATGANTTTVVSTTFTIDSIAPIAPVSLVPVRRYPTQ
jgi:hypothetical protein